MFSFVCVCLSVCLSREWSHVTITSDALDVTVQAPHDGTSLYRDPSTPQAWDITVQTCSFVISPTCRDIWWLLKHMGQFVEKLFCVTVTKWESSLRYGLCFRTTHILEDYYLLSLYRNLEFVIFIYHLKIKMNPWSAT